MNHTLTIARKEALDHLLSLKFYVCLVAMAALLGLSTFVMYRDYSLRMDNYAVLRERARPRPGESGVMAVVPPRPLSIAAKGFDELMGRGYTVTAYLGIEPHERQTAAATLFSLFAPPDLLYVVKIILPLIALLLAYDSVSGERERGTLKLILASAVARGELVAGKMLGGLAVIVVPFLAVLIGALLVLVTRPSVGLMPGDLGRLALMIVAALVYIALFFALGILVSAAARRSASALVVSLFAWAVIVFVLPNVGNLLAEQLAPVPSADTQETIRYQTFARNRFVAIQSRGRDPEGNVSAFNRDYDRAVEQYRAKLNTLVDTSKAMCRVSPAAALSYIFTDLAGTGLVDERRLGQALVDFKSRNLKALALENTPNAPKLSVFEFSARPLGTTLREGVLADLAALLATAALLFVGAAFMFLRADPR